MELSYLKEFVVISDLLNFSKAARRLYTTQSVLSKHVAKMESELDVKLFERDSHSMALTDEGRLFGEYARLIVNKYDEALAGLENMAASAGRIVTVGYLAGPFGLFMPKIKETVEKRCVGVSLKPRSLGLDDLKKELIEGKVDVALTYDISPELRSMCDAVRLSQSRIFAVVPQDGPLAGRECVTLDDIAGLDFMLPDSREWPVVASFFASAIPGYSSFSCVGSYSDIDTLIYAVRAGGCIGLSCGRHVSFEPVVKYLPIEGIDTSFGIGAMWLKDNDKPQVSQLAEALEAERDGWLAKRLLLV